jgi:hypothetical protein
MQAGVGETPIRIIFVSAEAWHCTHRRGKDDLATFTLQNASVLPKRSSRRCGRRMLRSEDAVSTLSVGQSVSIDRTKNFFSSKRELLHVASEKNKSDNKCICYSL